MALSVCAECTTKYAVGLPKCPHCGSTDHVEDGQPMPKITVHGGPSDKTLPVDEPEADEAPAVELAPEPEGGEESSPGSSSSASTETQQPNSEPSSKSSPKPARKTASRSAKGRTENSSAPSTDGGQETGTSAADDSGAEG